MSASERVYELVKMTLGSSCCVLWCAQKDVEESDVTSNVEPSLSGRSVVECVYGGPRSCSHVIPDGSTSRVLEIPEASSSFSCDHGIREGSLDGQEVFVMDGT